MLSAQTPELQDVKDKAFHGDDCTELVNCTADGHSAATPKPAHGSVAQALTEAIEAMNSDDLTIYDSTESENNMQAEFAFDGHSKHLQGSTDAIIQFLEVEDPANQVGTGRLCADSLAHTLVQATLVQAAQSKRSFENVMGLARVLCLFVIDRVCSVRPDLVARMRTVEKGLIQHAAIELAQMGVEPSRAVPFENSLLKQVVVELAQLGVSRGRPTSGELEERPKEFSDKCGTEGHELKTFIKAYDEDATAFDLGDTKDRELSTLGKDSLVERGEEVYSI